jgi:hypothetical protein
VNGYVAYGSIGAAGKDNTPSGVLAGIWSNFSDKTAKEVSSDGTLDGGNSLQYYGKWAEWQGNKQVFAPPVDLAGLLATRDGQCTAFVELLYNAILAQGLPQDAEGIGKVQMLTIQANLTPPTEPNAPAPPQRNQLGLMVAPWTFGAPNNEDLATKVQYPWVNQVKSIMQASPGVKSWIHVFRYQVYDFSGKPAVSYEGDAAGTKLHAQNNWNPLATFGNHVVVDINGMYFDPSYGVVYPALFNVPYAALANMQNKAIAGFYSIAKLKSTKTMLIFQREEETKRYLYAMPYNPPGS